MIKEKTNPFVKLGRWIKDTFKWLFDWKDWKLLLRNIPSLVVTLFIASVIAMNLLANRELVNISVEDINSQFYGVGLALDCGFTLSWISFLCMDMICKRFGPKASTKISILALLVNLVLTGIFALLMLTPGKWGEWYTYANYLSDGTIIETSESISANASLNSTFAGTWYVVFGSSVAMLVSAIVNAILNWVIGKAIKDNGNTEMTYKKFAIRSFVSTGIAQFVDNLVFATLVSKIFFDWSWWQVIICSLVGAIMELVCEVLLSPIGYKMTKNWQKENVGKEYLEFASRGN